MNAWLILGVSLLYLGLLFGIAYLSDWLTDRGRSLIRNPYVYALSLAVYCTAWTFYGSVGLAAEQGLGYLAIYIGPALAAPLWFVVLRKLILIARSQRINSIADFISARYGKSVFLGGLVTVIAIGGIIPYISLQLKAISFSFNILIAENQSLAAFFDSNAIYRDTTFYITIILAVFTILFGTRHLEASERHEGLVAAIAFESLIKLLAFLAVGIFVTFGLFDGPGALFTQAYDQLEALPSGMAEVDGWSWGWIGLISMFAVLLLPRQFHLAVVENTDPRHVTKAMWLFPLYLLLINLFVLPIALGGSLTFSGQAVEPDTYVLNLPLAHQQYALSLLVFVGGLSASTSMVIVATIALSIMTSNNLIVPFLLRTSVIRERRMVDLSGRLRAIRRLIIVVLLLLAYVYFLTLGQQSPLVAIGLISFVAVAQFAPALLGGLFWKDATKAGAAAGMIAGCLVWVFTLPLPTLVESGLLPQTLLENGLFGWSMLRPYALFGVEGMGQVPHSAFWSLFFNLLCYVGVSLNTQPSVTEHTQADLFVNIERYVARDSEATGWRGQALLPDIRLLLNRFLGPERTQALLQRYARRQDFNLERTVEAPADLVTYAETQLAGAIGAASARLLISSVVKEEALNIKEVMEALDETQQVMRYSQQLEVKSRELEQASQELKAANARLREMAQLKDDFIATVTHELRTPITSIRSLTSIIHEYPDLAAEKRGEFLGIIISESERISRLINQVLDLEKMESGQTDWEAVPVDLGEVVQQAVDGVRQLCEEKKARLTLDLPADLPAVQGDADRLTQVMVNLLANAQRFCAETEGLVAVVVEKQLGKLRIGVRDNGPGIAPEAQPYIFDKFTQFTDHRSGRRQGSGLGLSITRRIVELHGGTIAVESVPGKGATFWVELPTISEAEA